MLYQHCAICDAFFPVTIDEVTEEARQVPNKSAARPCAPAELSPAKRMSVTEQRLCSSHPVIIEY